jgi:hypothetical protein
MLEKHNQMLVELLSKLHPSGSLAADDLRSLTKARARAQVERLSFRACNIFIQLQESIKKKISN